MAAIGNKTFSIVELRYDGSLRRYETKQDAIGFGWTAKAKTIPVNWAFGIEARTHRVDMPGSSEPVEQVLGTHFTQAPWTGKWDDRWAGTGYAKEARLKMEALVASCSPVKVEHDGLNFIGIIKRASFTVRKPWLIEYSIELSPHFRDGEQRKDSYGARSAPPQDYTLQVEQIAAQMAAVHRGAPQRYMIDIFGLVDLLMKRIASRVSSMKAVVSTRVLSGAAESLVSSAAKVVSDLKDMRSSAMETRTLLAGAKSTVDLYFEDTLIAAEYDTWARGMATEGRKLALIAAEAAREIEKRITGNVQALYRPQAGESLYAIATRFFGTPSAWRQIAELNNLDEMELTGTELIAIPVKA
jgi:hypothetical protein